MGDPSVEVTGGTSDPTSGPVESARGVRSTSRVHDGGHPHLTCGHMTTCPDSVCVDPGRTSCVLQGKGGPGVKGADSLLTSCPGFSDRIRFYFCVTPVGHGTPGGHGPLSRYQDGHTRTRDHSDTGTRSDVSRDTRGLSGPLSTHSCVPS